MKNKLFFLLLMVVFSSSLFAAQDYYSFSTARQQERFQQLTNQFRCLVCQNQTIAESNSGLAADLRDQVYHQIQQGQSDNQIIDYLVTRYGNFVLYQPPLNYLTLLLWFGPSVILFFSLGYLFYYLRACQKTNRRGCT